MAKIVYDKPGENKILRCNIKWTRKIQLLCYWLRIMLLLSYRYRLTWVQIFQLYLVSQIRNLHRVSFQCIIICDKLIGLRINIRYTFAICNKRSDSDVHVDVEIENSVGEDCIFALASS